MGTGDQEALDVIVTADPDGTISTRRVGWNDEIGTAFEPTGPGNVNVSPTGEVAAQGLYLGHAAVARDPEIEQQLLAAADEELDHLSWCEQRLRELDAGPSRLRPLWYGGAWLIGAASGVLGDRWSLGFVEETERQVAEHLSGHLERLPAGDVRSRAIITKMRDDEERHGAQAKQAGAGELPTAVRRLMRAAAGVMTRTAYHW